MRIVFFGTPDYALPILTSIHKKFVTGQGKSPIVAVVTQSPKPVGREQKMTYSPIDHWAHERKIPIFYSSKELLKAGVDANLGVLASYGEIIPSEVISLFSNGILNIHPSLLPKYRGASPIQATIINGERETGVSIIRLDEKMDHGPIISQFKEEVLPTDTAGTLRERLFSHSAEVICELIEPYLAGKIKPRGQNHNEATFTKILKKEDGYIDLERFISEEGADKAERFIRAMDPWPGAWTQIQLNPKREARNPKRLKILKAHLENDKLVLDKVQLEGKGPVIWKQFEEGYKDAFFVPED
jgi:methionyl-tRNA formyltransferase